MKYTFTLLVVILVITSQSFSFAQADYNAYLERGVAAAENYSFSSAEDIFKDARKYYRKAKDKVKKDEFDDLADKAKYLGKAHSALRSAESRASSSQYKEAAASIATAKINLRSAKSKFHKALTGVEEDIDVMLEDAEEDMTEQRLTYIDERIMSGNSSMDNGSYSSAVGAYGRAKSAMINSSEESKYSINALISKAQAQEFIIDGDNAYNRADYILAYRKYKIAAEKGQRAVVSTRMGECQRNICTGMDRSAEALQGLTQKQLEDDQKIAIECNCSSEMQRRYKTERERRATAASKPAASKPVASTYTLAAPKLATAQVKKPSSKMDLVVLLEKISVDDHSEKIWGFVDVQVVDLTNGQVIKNTRIWGANRSNPITAYPAVMFQPYTNNAMKSFTLSIDEEKLRNKKYEIRYSLNLACGHKDNDFAAWGAHEMGRTAKSKIVLSNKYYDSVIKEKSQKYSTDSNRRHIFQLHWSIRAKSKKS